MDDSALSRLFAPPPARQLQPTGQIHPITGRPIFIDPDGYPETEKSITLQDDRLNGGAFTNLPTVWGNQQKTDPTWAVNNALISGQQFPSYSTLSEALAAAHDRSRVLGNFLPTTIRNK